MRALLEELRAGLVFVAGDLSDPHGTHRMCKEAIDARCSTTLDARPAIRGARAVALPRRLAGVAGDRGDVARPDVAGGAAAQDPGDLQAPVAEGLGALPRARTSASSGSASKQRNKDTAAMLDRLGLAEYFAMEAYVVT